ncbi:UDP-glucose 4-epimerase GalE [Cellulomonas chitinilytica]|uniref:UDP-glucose 4-epimerase GalE n=1 Tax=Cellulomonas chitinilytica TaxID=398759 RepID=UPI0019409D20|nr:UDP-glucose 4-epimerase GalE [Cellulomonas chitinilytica]
MSVLVTGGAGYIGAHVVRVLTRAGHDVVVADSLATGRAARIGAAPLLRVDLASAGAVEPLTRFLEDHRVDAVIHLAALKRADESVDQPARYYAQNLGALTTVLLAMRSAGVRDIVLSSSAAVYGEPTTDLVPESHDTRPLTPYGATKLGCEDLLGWSAAAGDVRAVSLRYFNVAGAGWPDLGDDGTTNLVSILVDRVLRGTPPEIFGDDYPTADGTCVRDYVHVLDLAEAHVAALERLRTSGVPHEVFNVGTGAGTSVREVVDRLEQTVDRPLGAVVRPRRTGDSASVVGAVDAFQRATGWRARRTLQDMLVSALEARRATAGVD